MNTRYRLRSLSSSGIAPTKRRKSPTGQSPPYVAKITTALPDHSSFNYIQSLSKVPPSYSAPSPSHIPSMKRPPSRPPYLKELSQTFSCNRSIHPQSKEVPVPSPHPQSYGGNSENIKSHSTSSNKTSPSMAIYGTDPFNPGNSANETKGLLQPQHSLLQWERKSNASLSLSSDESPVIKYGDVSPLLPARPSSPKDIITEINPPPLPCSEPLLCTEQAHGTVPPAPCLPFKLQCGSNQTLLSTKKHLWKSLDPSLESQPVQNNKDTASKELVSSNKFHGQPNEQSLFLDQIRKGVQLKTVRCYLLPRVIST